MIKPEILVNIDPKAHMWTPEEVECDLCLAVDCLATFVIVTEDDEYEKVLCKECAEGYRSFDIISITQVTNWRKDD